MPSFDWEEYHRHVMAYYRPLAEVPKEEDRLKVVAEATAWLNTAESEQLRNEFLDRVCDTIKRTGVDDLLRWLDTTDFWVAPASTRYHESEAGGLVRHSLRVHDELDALHDDLMMRYPETFDRGYTPETLALTALFHDFCKVQFYAPAGKWRKDDGGRWYLKQEWVSRDQMPIGHGEKSVYLLLSCRIGLTPEEAGAVRWHMGAYEPSVVVGGTAGYAHRDAREKWPLVLLLQMADQIAQQREIQLTKDKEAADAPGP